MTLFSLILRNLFYFWRGNLAVLLGVAVGATVLTGALLVGDSLQGSLRDRALTRLGWVEQVVIAPRFFDQALATRLGEKTQPAILLQGTVLTGDRTTRRQVRAVTILGVEPAFFGAEPPPAEYQALLNGELAQALEVQQGEPITLRLMKPGTLPRETALARKETTLEDWNLSITAILPENRFSLRPGLDEPRNVFVPLAALQERLGQKGQVNALLMAGDPEKLRQALDTQVTLEDRGLKLLTPADRARALLDRYDRNRDGVLRGAEWFRREQGKRVPRFASVIAEGIKPASPEVLTLAEITDYYVRAHPYLSLESSQLLIPPTAARAALEAARETGLDAAPTVVYLCRLAAGGTRIAGVVAALDPGRTAPLGPFLPPGKKELGRGEVVLVDAGWPEGKRPAVGDSVTLSFKPPESHGPTADLTKSFRIAGFIPMRGVAADPGLTPEFPGITDKDNLGDWTLPFEDPPGTPLADTWSQQIVRKEYTEAYWDSYRATPRAYINLADGLELWTSRFGGLTAIRLAPGTEPGGDAATRLTSAASRFRAALSKKLPPAQTGLVLDEVRKNALAASSGSTPFGLLFLGFSFFLIASALLLVGLLYRLTLDRRARQMGVFFAEGYRRSTLFRLLLGEGGLVALIGVLAGLAGAVLYARLLVQLLSALWPGGVLQSFLAPHTSSLSLLLGGLGALFVSLLTIAWVVRSLSRVPPRALLAGQTTGDSEPGYRPPTGLLPLVAIACTVLGGVLLAIGPLVPGHEAQAGTFFGAGALFLTAGLVGLNAWMQRAQAAQVEGGGWVAIARLGVRNAARNPARSLLTVGLLASAAFLLVAVESFRRRAEMGNGSPEGIDGGFALIAETDLPIIRDLKSSPGQRELFDKLERNYLAAGATPAQAREQLNEAEKLLAETAIYALRARAGDDASCLNLYKPRSPRVLGVPAALIARGGFHFAATQARRDNPWKLLEEPGKVIPAFGEANTVMWILQTGIGGVVKVPDAAGEPTALTIAGTLQDSVFQSSLLVSEERFLQLYPAHEGYNYLLIAPPAGKEGEVRRLLEQGLADRGIEVSVTRDKLAAYLAVENTYLTTFQALGGLGLILGSLGLAVVLLRGVWERRAELALFRALGWRKRALGWLVLAENGFLLVLGLFLGSVAALLSILPQLLRGEGSVPVQNLLLLFAGVLAAGLAAGLLAVIGTLRAPIVPALRKE